MAKYEKERKNTDMQCDSVVRFCQTKRNNYFFSPTDMPN